MDSLEHWYSWMCSRWLFLVKEQAPYCKRTVLILACLTFCIVQVLDDCISGSNLFVYHWICSSLLFREAAYRQDYSPTVSCQSDSSFSPKSKGIQYNVFHKFLCGHTVPLCIHYDWKYNRVFSYPQHCYRGLHNHCYSRLPKCCTVNFFSLFLSDLSGRSW